MNKRIFSVFLALAMVVSMLPITAIATGTAVGYTVTVTQDEETADVDLFEGYVYQQMGQGISTYASDYGETLLDDHNLLLYRALKAAVVSIAGNGGSTVVTVDPSVYSDLTATYDNTDSETAASNAAVAIGSLISNTFDLGSVIDCLIADCPYELYWYDKTQGTSMSYSYSYGGGSVSIAWIKVSFRVSEDFQAEGYDATAPAMIDDVCAIANAAQNAIALVDANANESDMQKLYNYKTYILNAVTYNDEAAEGGASYGNPWQLIWVFDGDDSTNVVCEGYSKAFQYLCEQSDFTQQDISCYSMTGYTNDGAHMWNVVSIDGVSYLADLTNCDYGYIGQNGELFLNCEPVSGDEYGYTFNINGTDVVYQYFDDVVALYPASVRTLGTASGEADTVVVAIDETTFPDEIFRNYVSTNFDTDGDGALSAAEIAKVVSIDVHNDQNTADDDKISDLTGIQYFTALMQINCSWNKITALDVSGLDHLNSVYCYYNQISTFTATPSILYLTCYGNDMQALDVSRATGLTSLDCTNNALTALDLSNNTALTMLSCYSNQLTELDVSANTALQYLMVDTNELTKLDVSGLTALEILTFANNSLTSLDVSSNTALTSLNGVNNAYTVCLGAEENTFDLSTLPGSFDVSKASEWAGGSVDGTVLTVEDGATAVTYTYDCGNEKSVAFTLNIEHAEKPDGYLITSEIFPDPVFIQYIFENIDTSEDAYLSDAEIAAVTKLDLSDMGINTLKGISEFAYLEELDCSNNPLAELDVTANSELTSLDCSHTDIKDLYLHGNPELSSLNCDYTAITWLDFTSNPNLIEDVTVANGNYTIGVYNGIGMFKLDCMPDDFNADLATFSDAVEVVNGRLVIPDDLESFTYVYNAQNGQFPTIRILVDHLEPDGVGVAIDEANFPDKVFRSYISWYLDTDLIDGYLSEYEIAQVTKLDLSDMGINTLKGISEFAYLEELDCSNNPIIELDISANTALTELDCDETYLTRLNLENNTALTNDVSNANGKYTIQVSRSDRTFDLTSLGDEADPFDLSVVYAGDNCSFDENKNLIIDEDAEYVTYLYASGDQCPTYRLNIEWVDGEEPTGIPIDEEHFPDEAFRNYLLWSVDTIDEETGSPDGYLSDEEIAAVTVMDVSGRGISSLEGINIFTNLQTLDCSNNAISSLDVSTLEQLSSLNCANNAMGEMILGNLPNLKELWCSNNSFTSLDLSSYTAIEHLNCNSNQLTSLILGENDVLTTLYCTENQLASLDVSGCPALEALYCGGNQLESLDVSRNTQLTSLVCWGNNLTALNLENNTELDYLGCWNNQIGSLDLSNNTQLTQLNCARNELYQLDLSNNAELIHLAVDNNSLTEMAFGSNPKLQSVSCSNNNLYALDLSGLTELTGIWCYNNDLRSLDFSDNTALQYLYCSDNLLTWLDLQNHYSITNLVAENFSHTIMVDENNTYDISNMPEGFDPDRATWYGCTYADGVLTLDENATSYYYTYDCGSYQSIGVTLNVEYGTEMVEVTVNVTTNSEDEDIKASETVYVRKDNITPASVSEALCNAEGKEVLQTLSNGLKYTVDVSATVDLYVYDATITETQAIVYSTYDENAAAPPNAQPATLADADLYLLGYYETPLDSSLILADMYANGVVARLANREFSHWSLNGNIIRPVYQVSLSNVEYYTEVTLIKANSSSDIIYDEAQLRNGDYWILDSIEQGTVYLPNNDADNWYEYLANYIKTAAGSSYTTPAYCELGMYCAKEFCMPDTNVFAMTYYSEDEADAPEGSLQINAYNFPDEAFRAYLSEKVDTDEDGYLSAEERNAVTEMDVTGWGITTLYGIGNFNNLQTLICSENYLTSLDLSGTQVSGDDEHFAYAAGAYTVKFRQDQYEYDLNQFPAGFDAGKVTEVITTGVTFDADRYVMIIDEDTYQLMYENGETWVTYTYDCGNDVTAMFALKLEIAGMYIEQFPDEAFREYLSQNVDTDGDGYLSDAEISVVTEMDVTGWGITTLSGIDVFGNLETLICSENYLTSLSLEGTKVSADTFTCESGAYTVKFRQGDLVYGLDQLPAGFDVGKVLEVKTEGVTFDAEEYVLCISEEIYRSMEENGEFHMTYVYDCGNNVAATFMIKMELDGGVYINEDNFPDAGFRETLQGFDLDGDGYLTGDEIGEVTEIDVTGCGMTTLYGINRFYNLEKLYFDGNYLTSLDIGDTKLTSITLDSSPYTITVGSNRQYDLSNLPMGFDVNQTADWSGGSVVGNILTVDSNTTFVSYTYSCGRKLYASFCLTVNVEIDESYIPIDAEHFPDEIFRNYVSENFDTDGDGQLSTSEIAVANSIDYSLYPEEGEDEVDDSLKIKDLTGVAYLTELQELLLDNNGLTELDVSALVKLENLQCVGNSLTELDLSNNTELRYLYVYNNNLTKLDVSNNTALLQLWCGDNQLTELDVSANTALEALICGGNQLTELDVSNNPALVDLAVDQNSLTELDLTNNENLITLLCDNNLLTTLDVSNLSSLTDLSCRNNQLTTLDVSGNTALKELHCSNNSLTTLNVTGCSSLQRLDCYSNSLTTLDVSGCVSLTYLDCDSNQLTELDLGDVTALEMLYCSFNRLTTLDVSNNPALVELNITENCLSELDVSSNTALQSLRCSDNQLTELDLSSNTSLTKLSCNWTALTYLDLNNCPTFTADCSNEYGTYTVTVKAADRTFDLTTLSEKFDVSRVNTYENCTLDGNNLVIDEGVAYVLYIYNSTNGQSPLFRLNIEWEEEYLPIDEEHFPDEAFRNYILENIDTQSDAKLVASEANAVFELDVTGLGISNLEGIGYFPLLMQLNCSQNSLTSLDLSENTNLIILICDNNKLRALDVSALANLRTLSCSYNQLSTLDVSQNANLSVLTCSSNLLSELDVSANTALTSLTCESNRLTSLDVSALTALKKLYCSSNRLTGLTLGNNSVLAEVWCNYNNLTSLDTSGCTALQNLICFYNTYSVTVDADDPVFDLSELPSGFILANASDWVGGTVSGSTLTVNADATEVTYTYACGNGLTAEFTLEIDAEVVVTINDRRFPDPHFREHVKKYDLNKDGKLDRREILLVKDMDIHGMGIKDLKGIEHFTELEVLDCHDNELSVLNVGKNKKLRKLHCHGTGIKSLDVSANVKLEELNCSNNKLTVMDISKLEGLTWFDCSGNKLTGLDLEKNTKLGHLACSDNNLTKLEVKHLAGLYELNCKNNYLTHLDIGDLKFEEGKFHHEGNKYEIGVGGDKFDMNELPKADGEQFDPEKVSDMQGAKIDEDGIITIEPGAEVVTYQYTLADDTVMTFTLDINATEIEINALNFPDENFRAYVALFDLDDSGTLSQAEIKQVTQISLVAGKARSSISYAEIESLEGINYFTSLETLICQNTAITKLDVTAIDTLTSVDCSGNEKLTVMELGDQPALTTLTVAGNSIETLDLSGLSSLTTLDCSQNSLTELDLSCNTTLTEVVCSENSLTTLDLSGNNSITTVVCSSNQLTDLNVSGCAALTSISCSDNQLTSVDTEGSTALKTVEVGTQEYTIAVNENTMTFDLNNLPGGFDVTKVHEDSWVGGSVDENGILTVAAGVGEVTYTYDVSGIATNFALMVNLTNGVTLAGTFQNYKDADLNTVIELWAENATEAAYSTTVTGLTGSYAIENVMAGTYTMKVSKQDHVTREYTVVIGDVDATQDVVICLIGDVNGDGDIDNKDATQVKRYYNNLSSSIVSGDEHDAYRLLVADVNGDGEIDNKDATRIKRHYNNLSSIFG